MDVDIVEHRLNLAYEMLAHVSKSIPVVELLIVPDLKVISSLPKRVHRHLYRSIKAFVLFLFLLTFHDILLAFC